MKAKAIKEALLNKINKHDVTAVRRNNDKNLFNNLFDLKIKNKRTGDLITKENAVILMFAVNPR